MSAVTSPEVPAAGSVELGGVADDLARAALAMARRYSVPGATLWCASGRWPFHAHHVAVEFVHPVIMGKRALAALTVPPGADLVTTLRASVRRGDMVVALAPAGDRAVADAMRRGQAWGVETIWIGAGPRPPAGAADHVVWLDTDDELAASEQFVRLYHMLWELTHVCFEHPGLMKAEPECNDEVCITCSDEGRLAEVVLVEGDEAVVRTAEGQERIDISLVDPPGPGDLVLVHAGFAIQAGEALL
ncbi:MAG TPA: HypC/HybG/HupF family hydrogenase formation chaperone [Acidimicrobiales bacterium]|jgi:phosphoheptose isomerase|nr:HypC/HybG/HupF family hydrogenase formation chaperone [Acidimicrobiales bacterium]